MRYLDADSVAALGPAAAVDAITRAIVDGIDPATDPARTPVVLSHGEFLLMPSESDTAAGVKIVTVAPDNPARGLPRIFGLYLLFDRDTLTLTAALDGTALTSLRTPAVSVAAVRPHLPDHPLRLVIVESGPQAVGHAAAFRAVYPMDEVAFLVRDPARTNLSAFAVGSAEADDKLERADVVVTATSASTPVFDSTLLSDEVTVIAVGSHHPQFRELDGALLARSTVVVEDVATAVREAGDVALALAENALAVADLVTLSQVVTRSVEPPRDRPLVFKSVGMSWEDLVVAAAVLVGSPTSP